MGEINLFDEDSLYTGLWLVNSHMDMMLEKSAKDWLNNKKYEFALLNSFKVEMYEESVVKNAKKIIIKKVDLENQKITEKHSYLINSQSNEIKQHIDTDTMYKAGYYWKGLRVGKWVFYTDKGYKKSNVEYKLGILNGYYQVFYENGQISELGFWENNRNVGEFIHFYENGNKSEQFTFNTLGMRDGIAKYYHNNGIISKYLYVKNAVTNGFVLDFDSLGSLIHVSYCLYNDCNDTILNNNAPIDMMLIAVKSENQHIFNKYDIISLNVKMDFEREQKKKYLIGMIFILSISILLIFSVFQLKKSKNKITKQMLLIKQQKKFIEKTHHKLAEHHKEIQDSITYAKRIQEAILPSMNSMQEALKDGFVLYLPKDIVAGDFYWMERVGFDFAQPTNNDSDQPNNNDSAQPTVYFAAADCTGHGVPGAMVSVVCNGALNRAVREFGLTESGKILDKARELVIQEFEKSDEEVKDGMDISLCAWNKIQLVGLELQIIRYG
jgi:antitoxin component YwqK of YwqJK toxin-antitoxin module